MADLSIDVRERAGVRVERRSPLRPLLEAGPMPYAVVDVAQDEAGDVIDLRVRYANPPARHALKCTSDCPTGQGVREKLPEDVADALLAACRAVLGTESAGEQGGMDIECAQCQDARVFRLGDHLGIVWQPEGAPARDLAEQARIFQMISEYASDMVYWAGPDRVIRWVSPSVTAALGWEPAELVGTRMSDLVHPDDRADTEGLRRRLYGGKMGPGRTKPLVVRMRTRSGVYRWMSAQASQVYGADGQPDGVVGGIHDVHELVLARAAAEEATEALRLSQLNIDAAAIGMAIVAPDGRFLQVNPALCQMLGYSAEELRDTTFLAITHPDDAAAGASALRELARGSRDAYSARKRYLTKTGEPVWVDLSVVAVRQPDSAAVGHYVSQLVNVTAEMTFLRQLQRSEDELRQALAGAPGGMAIADATGRITRVNPALCQMLGRSEAQLLGRTVAELLPEPVAAEMGPAPEAATYRLQVGGAEIWLEHSTRRVADGAGPTIQVHQFHDHTELYRMHHELRYRASHDPLTRVANRDGLFARLARRRSADRAAPIGVLFLDIDKFKNINDEYGHAAGDTVLAQVAARITGALRAGDFVARYGGDEFVILADVSTADQVLAVASNILAATSQPVAHSGTAIPCATSIGATLALPGEQADPLLQRADRALYTAKRSGRARVQYLPPPE